MATVPIRDILDNETGEPIFPRTHVKAVIGLADSNFFEEYVDGNGARSVKLRSDYVGLWAEGWISNGGIGAGGGGGGGGGGLITSVYGASDLGSIYSIGGTEDLTKTFSAFAIDKVWQAVFSLQQSMPNVSLSNGSNYSTITVNNSSAAFYTKSQVDALFVGIHSFDYVTASGLPTAGADTMYKIYLVPAADQQTLNVKDEYITIRSGSAGNYSYSWEQIGSTSVDLSGYVTTTALGNWTGSTKITTLGTITTGTWSGTAIGVTKGGTGLTAISKGAILYASAANTISALSANGTSTKKFLSQTSNNAPSWGTISLTDISGTSDLQSIEGLAGTSGFLKKTGTNTWALDTTSYLPTTGGTITGDIRLKDSRNYGMVLRFGDGDYCYISEDTDDHLKVYAAKGIDLATGPSYSVTVNGIALTPSEYVNLSDAQTITGIKTFTNSLYGKTVASHDAPDWYIDNDGSASFDNLQVGGTGVVTIANAQVITGEKTFSGGIVMNGSDIIPSADLGSQLGYSNRRFSDINVRTVGSVKEIIFKHQTTGNTDGLIAGADGYFRFRTGANIDTSFKEIIFHENYGLYPENGSSVNLGYYSSSDNRFRWANIYGVNADLTGDVLLASSSEIKIGNARIVWDGNNNSLRVTKIDGASGMVGLYVDGPLSSGGAVGQSNVPDELNYAGRLYIQHNSNDLCLTTGGKTIIGSYPGSSAIGSNKFYVAGSSIGSAWNTSSDERLKDNVRSVRRDEAVDTIMKLNPVTWTWNEKSELEGKRSAGLIAQQVESVIPFMVTGEELKGLNYTMLHAYEIGAIQSHEERIKELELQVDFLNKEIERLRAS